MHNIQTRPISKKTLVAVSIVADAVDVLLLVGISPGPWSLITEAPVTAMHFMYAGPKAALVLTEFIPFAGFLPIYTIAALLYPNPNQNSGPNANRPSEAIEVIEVTAVPPRIQRRP